MYSKSLTQGDCSRINARNIVVVVVVVFVFGDGPLAMNLSDMIKGSVPGRPWLDLNIESLQMSLWGLPQIQSKR